MSNNIVITMARQYGSGGKTIGAMLAKELGINCYSREILRMASEESGINERLFGMSDEKMKGAGWFKILSRPYDGELLSPEEKGFVSEENTGALMVPGMMFTIEPMVNMGSDEIYTDEIDEWTVRTEDGLPSAQWEVTVLVTETGCEVICW